MYHPQNNDSNTVCAYLRLLVREKIDFSANRLEGKEITIIVKGNKLINYSRIVCSN